jgi:DNA-directed RNA polymerase specialized sigma24 family protein
MSFKAVPTFLDGPDSGPSIENLSRMIRKITADPTLHEDLLQEAAVHLWLTESRRPGQTTSWYLQSCKFHLQHYLASGRSVDSAKRRGGQLQFASESEEGEGIPEQGDSGNSVLTSVSARELIALLSRHVSSQERAVLECLAEGLGPREIGRELNMSHTMVIKHRRNIAALLMKLEAGKAHSLSHRNGNRMALNGTNGHPRRGGGLGERTSRAIVPALAEAGCRKAA